MRNAGLEETQAGIKIAGRNINNLRYANDTTLMEESEEEPKSFLMKVKEESQKAGLKLNIKKPRSGEGNGNPLQYSWPGKSHGQKSLAGYSLWGRKCWT